MNFKRFFGLEWHWQPSTTMAKHDERDLRIIQTREAESLTDPDAVTMAKRITARWRERERQLMDRVHQAANEMEMEVWRAEAAKEHLERTREVHKVEAIRRR